MECMWAGERQEIVYHGSEFSLYQDGDFDFPVEHIRDLKESTRIDCGDREPSYLEFLYGIGHSRDHSVCLKIGVRVGDYHNSHGSTPIDPGLGKGFMEQHGPEVID